MMETSREIEVKANGLTFAALASGEGPLVLCLHGFPDHARSFRCQAPALNEAGYRVVMPYLRGYAPSQASAEGVYQGAALARDVVALIEALGEREAVVIGHDWGALAAYGAAVLEPERISRLVTLAVPYGPAFIAAVMTDYSQLKRSWYMYLFQSPLAGAIVAADNCRFIRNLWCDWSPGWDLPEYEMDLLRDTFSRPGVIEAALDYYRCMLDPARHVSELAADQARIGSEAIKVEALYLHGRDDGCLSVDLVVGMDEVFPAGLTTVLVDAAGHFLHQEKPGEVNRAILDFLGPAEKA